MSKLFRLKKWLTLADAAKYLTALFGEDVGQADVLRLGLDGHLQLSIHFVNGAYARRWIVVAPESIKWNTVPTLDLKGTLQLPEGGPVWTGEDGLTRQLSKAVIELENEVWDLPLLGAERLDIEHEYQRLTEGPAVTGVFLDGTLVRSTAGDFYQLQAHFSDNEYARKLELKKPYRHPDNFYPAGGLPEGSVIVVRTDALSQLQNHLANDSGNRLPTRERDTLLKLVIGLAMSGYSFDPAAARSEVPKEIVGDLSRLGISIDGDTVRKYLKEAVQKVLPATARR